MPFHLQQSPSVSVQHILIPRTYFMTISPLQLPPNWMGCFTARLSGSYSLTTDHGWLLHQPNLRPLHNAYQQCSHDEFQRHEWILPFFLLITVLWGLYPDASRTTPSACKPISPPSGSLESFWILNNQIYFFPPWNSVAICFYHHYALALCTSYLFAHIIFRTDVLLRVISCVFSGFLYFPEVYYLAYSH